MKYFSPILLLIMLSLALGWAMYPRLQQNKVIDQIYASKPDVPFYATLDAPSFIIHAKDATRSGHYLRVPLLGAILARLAEFKPDKNHYTLANHLIPFLAGLFMIPLAIYFYLLGKPAIGLLGGLLGALNLDYMIRASVGRIDTDMLNLFFPFLASLILLCLLQNKRQWFVYLDAALFAVTIYLFMWWYDKPVFAIIYGAVFLLVLLLRRPIPLPLIGGLVLVAGLVVPFHWAEIQNQLGSIYHSYILNALPFLKQAGLSSAVTESINYPNISKTITEIRLMAPNQIFLTLVSHAWWGWVGLGFLIAGVAITGRKLLPLLPVLLIGLLCFWFGRRFGMYLAPFIGIGFGFGIYFILDRIPVNKYFREVMAYALSFVLCFFMTTETARGFVPRPSVVPEIIQTYQLLKTQTPTNARILTWWDDGYTIQDQAERRVYHDGGSHDGRKTYLVARALSSKSQEELAQINRFMLAKSEDEISQFDSSQEKLREAIFAESSQSEQPSYVIYTWNTVKLFSAIYWIGQWDPVQQNSVAKGFNVLQCQQSPTKLICGHDDQIDLKDGTYHMGKNTYKVKRLLQIDHGEIANEIDYHRDTGVTLEVFPNGGKQNTLTVMVMEDVVYQSNFNQMFLLGKYDRNLFEEVSNRFPVSRLYRFRENHPSP